MTIFSPGIQWKGSLSEAGTPSVLGLKSLSGFDTSIGGFMLATASLVSWAASAELEPGAGSGVSNECR